MEYFNSIPTLSYNSSVVRNIFSQVYFTDTITEDLYHYYRMSDEENLWSVSKKLYNDESNWWILAILNDIKDVFFDTPLSYDILKEKTKTETNQYLKVDATLYSTANLNSPIVYSTTITGTLIEKLIDATDYYIRIELNDYNYLFPESAYTVTISSISGYNILTFASNSTLGLLEDTTSEQWLTDYLSNLNDAEAANDLKRVIKVIKPEYITNIVADLNV